MVERIERVVMVTSGSGKTGSERMLEKMVS